MILLIDAGNTRAKIAWLAPGASRRSSPSLVLDYHQLQGLANRLASTPQRILGSNVAGPDARAALEHACETAWGLAVQWCDTGDGHALLHNRYHPTELGTDRWLGMLGLLPHLHDAAAWQAGSPCLLASFGTATTVDTLMPQPHAHGAARAAFVGGLILPGTTLMAHSLTTGTAQLPLGQGSHHSFPLNTHDAIVSGIAAAQAGALLRQWRLAMQAADGKPPLIYVCGGGWPWVRDELGTALARAQADLGVPDTAPVWLEGPVLDGLANLANPR